MELIGGIEWWKFDVPSTEGAKAKTEGLKIQYACLLNIGFTKFIATKIK